MSRHPGKAVQMQAVLSELTDQQRATLSAEFGIDANITQQQLLTLAVEHERTSAALAARACEAAIISGVYLIQLKASCKHGEYGELLDKAGFSSQRASEFTRLATRYGQLSPEARKALSASLSKKHAFAISTLDAERIESLAENGDLDDLAAKPLPQLFAEIRKLRRENALAKEDAKQARFEADQARRVTQKLLRETVTVREESMAHTEQMMLELEALEHLYNNLLVDPARFGKDNADQRVLAAGTFYHRVNALHARLGHIVARIQDEFGEEVTGSSSAALALMPEEIELLTGRFQDMAKAHNQSARVRDKNREASGSAFKAKRGRPIGGSKKKPHG